MKKFLSVLLTILLVFAIVPQGAIPARAASEWLTVPGIEGGQIQFDSSTGTITDCETSVTVANVPSTINGISVTSIGEYAFHGCRKLISVVLPNGVSNVGDCAFQECSNLISVNMTDNVTEIGGGAFIDCRKLESINLSRNLKSIDGLTFMDCFSLKDIEIPDSITQLGERAFEACIELSNVVIPNGMVKIGTCAFAGCKKLNEIEIPDNVTSMGINVFQSCVNLENIFVTNRNKSYCSIEGVLYSEDKSTLISYPSGKKGEYRVPSFVRNIKEHAFDSSTNLTAITIPDSVEIIGERAFTRCGELVSVEFEGKSIFIDYSAFSNCTKLRKAIFQKEAPRIGSYVFSNCSSNFCIYYYPDASGWSTPTWNGYACKPIAELYEFERRTSISVNKYLFHVIDSAGKPINGATVSVDGVPYQTDEKGGAMVPSSSVDNPVITISKSGYQSWTNANSNWKPSTDRYETIVLYSETEGRYKLREARYSVNKDFSPPAVDLLTQTKKLALKNDGNLIGDLDSGDFYLSARSYDSANTKAYQLFQKDHLIAESGDGNFSLNVKKFSKGGDCTICAIGTDGSKSDTAINLEFVENKVNQSNSISLSNGAIKLKVNDDISFLGGSTITTKMPESLPIDFEITESKIHVGVNMNLYDENDSGTQKKSKWEKMKKSFEAAEKLKDTAFQENKIKDLLSLVKEDKAFQMPKTGNLTMNVLGYGEADLGSKEIDLQIIFVVKAQTRSFGFNTVVYVVPVTVQVKAFVEAKAIAKTTYNWEAGTLKDSINLKVTLGLDAFGGVGAGEVVGVGAYGKASLGSDIRLRGSGTGLQNMDLTGELGLKAYLAFLTYERAFAHHTWNLYTANSTRTAAQRKIANALQNKNTTMGDIFDIESYRKEDFSYLEKESGWLGGTVRRRAPARNGATAKVELTPLLTSTYRNARPALVSAGDKLYGAFLRMDENQRVYTTVTVFDGMTWSTPVRADSAAQLDDAPQLYADKSGKVFLTYAQTKPGTDGTNMLEYAKNQSIVVGTVAENGAFSKTNTFTPAAGSRAYLQTLGTVNGKPALVWAETAIISESDIFTPARTLVKLSTFDGTAWSTARTVTTLNHPLYSLTLGEEGVASLIDTDDDLHTTEDAKLSLFSTDGAETQLAAGVTGRVSYAKLPGETDAAFVWNAEESLVTSTGKIISAPGITSEYQITEDGIYYSRAEESSANLVKLPYAQGVWGEAMKLTNGGRYLENLQIASLSGNDYVFGMHTAVEITETNVTPDKNLVWARVVPISDLRIDSVEYDRDIVTPGEDVPVKISVTNVGDHAVSSVMLAKDGETPIDGGALAVGESKEITVNIPCPEALTEYTFTVAEGNQTTAADYTPDDNTAKTSIGYGNLAVTLSYEQIGEARDLVAVVKNTGVSKASGKVTFYDDAGATYAETKLGDMAAGDVVVVRFPVPEEFSSRFGGDVTAKVTADSEELYDYDNIATLNISEVLNAEITELTASDVGIAAHIHYEGKEGLAVAYCAFYNENGKMLKLRSAPLTAMTQEYYFESVPGAVKAKVFVLKNDAVPMCECKEVNLYEEKL